MLINICLRGCLPILEMQSESKELLNHNDQRNFRLKIDVSSCM